MTRWDDMVRVTMLLHCSTRPFLSHIEKKWIAFQLLVALEQCHTHKVHCHKWNVCVCVCVGGS